MTRPQRVPNFIIVDAREVQFMKIDNLKFDVKLIFMKLTIIVSIHLEYRCFRNLTYVNETRYEFFPFSAIT